MTGQNVIEVVRDAPRELADGLQLLSMVQAFLEPLVFGYVGGDRTDPHDLALPVEDRELVRQVGSELAVTVTGNMLET